MPEAEDVLLDAVERATGAARIVWRRMRPPGEAPGTSLSGERRRLSAWLAACFGRSWPIVASDPPPAPGWLARWMGRPPPWALRPVARAATDGAQLFLPRRLALGGPDARARERDLLLMMALGLGARIAGGEVAPVRLEAPVARDLLWCGAGALADAWLWRELPGLREALLRARREALASRPAPQRLRPMELRVEALVRELLVAPPQEAASWVGADAAAWARERARASLGDAAAASYSSYRGFAPVAHWGVPAPPAAGASRLHLPGEHSEIAPASLRSQALPRRPAARRVEEEELQARPGPFVLPFADPQLSVQDPGGLVRPRDQGDEPDLEALASELARQESMARLRSDEPVRDVLHAEGDSETPGAAGPDRAPAGAAAGVLYAYPEWDHRLRGYRPNACVVCEAPPRRRDPGWEARIRSERGALLAQVRRRFEALRPRRERRPRQLDGDTVDLDAWVEEHGDRLAGRTPPGRLYTVERPARRDVAVALLVDASGSTDGWVHGAQRVIDVEKEAALCFCEALDALGDRYALYAFSGRGARDVRLWSVKRFEERSADAARARIGGLEPGDATRLGAAIRHVAARLEHERARVRLLLLLSDGKPHDEDGYEGTYGVEDVRQAVAEARLAEIQVFCITIDREAPAYAARLFGPRGYTVLRNVRQLPERLTEIYRSVTARR